MAAHRKSGGTTQKKFSRRFLSLTYKKLLPTPLYPVGLQVATRSNLQCGSVKFEHGTHLVSY